MCGQHGVEPLSPFHRISYRGRRFVALARSPRRCILLPYSPVRMLTLACSPARGYDAPAYAIPALTLTGAALWGISLLFAARRHQKETL